MQRASEPGFGRLLDGPDREKDMVTTYAMVGLPIISPTDKPVAQGYVGEGMAIPWWEAWYQTGGSKGGGTTLSVLADHLLDAAAYPHTPDATARQDFQKAFLTDVISTMQSDANSDDRVYAFGSAVLSGSDYTSEAHLDALQADILSRTFAADLLFEAAHTAGSPEGVPTTHSVAPSTAAHNTPCRFNSAEQSVVRIAEEIISRAVRGQQLIPAPWIFDRASGGWTARLPGVIQLLGKYYPHIKTIAGKLGAAQLILDSLKLSAQIFSLTIDSSLDKQPLVRTKDQRAGEDAVLAAKVSIDIGAQWANCLRLVYAHLGLRGSLPQQGILAGHSVTIRGGRNFPTDVGEDKAKVWFTNIGLDRRPDNQLTDTAGIAKAGIQGVPQKKQMSQDPLDDTFSVRIAVKLNQNGILVDMWDAAMTAVRGTPQEAAASFVLNLLKRFRWEGPEQFFDLRDWKPETVYFVTDDHRYTASITGKGPSWSARNTAEFVTDPAKRSAPILSAMRCDDASKECNITFEAWSVDTFTSLTTKVFSPNYTCVHPYEEVIHQSRGLATVTYRSDQAPRSVEAETSVWVNVGGIGACVLVGGRPDRLPVTTNVDFETLMSGGATVMNFAATGQAPGYGSDTGEISYQLQQSLTVRRVNSDGSPYTHR